MCVYSVRCVYCETGVCVFDGYRPTLMHVGVSSEKDSIRFGSKSNNYVWTEKHNTNKTKADQRALGNPTNRDTNMTNFGDGPHNTIYM